MEGVEVLVGRIGKPHGVRGEVTVDVRTDEPDRRFADGARLRVEAPRGSEFSAATLEVVTSRWHREVLLVRFAELTDRELAESARNVLLHVRLDAGDLPDDPDEFYEHQLVGLEAVDLEGRPLGTVTRLQQGAAQDLLIVRTPEGRDALVPFVSALVPEVSLSERRVVIADRPGLVTPFPDAT